MFLKLGILYNKKLKTRLLQSNLLFCKLTNYFYTANQMQRKKLRTRRPHHMRV